MSDVTVPKNPERLEAEQLTALQPGFARLMPEIGDRMWKGYHAAQARNWELATWQLKEMRKLFRLGTVTRPKYGPDVEAYVHEELEPLFRALEAQDLEAFNHAYHEAVEMANEYHRRWKKGFIVWKTPEQPPQDLVLAPRA